MTVTSLSRVALVTAGSAGLGAATAKALAAHGLRVVINYSTNSERADALVKELYDARAITKDETKPQYLAIKADMSSPADIKDLVDRTATAMGRIDVVVSNHGWTRMTNFSNLDENIVSEDWDRCLNMNVKSHLLLAHTVRKYLEETEGVVIATSSTAGIRVSGSSLAYAVTKAAQIHLVRCLADIMAPKIRVNCVIPGMMMTDWSSNFSPTKINGTIKKTRLGRLATVEDVAQQICTFANSHSVTGANAVIDAGFSL